MTERTPIPGMYSRIKNMSLAVEDEYGWERRRALEAVFVYALHRTYVEEMKGKQEILPRTKLVAYANSLRFGWEYALDESRISDPDVHDVIPVLQERGFIK